MKYKTLFLVLSTTCGAVATTMFIGNLFFKAEFGDLAWVFLILQVSFLLLMFNSENEVWKKFI